MNKKIGCYNIIDTLGQGGNGIVYRVQKGDTNYALKKLRKNNKNTFTRFNDEIKVLLLEQNNAGILPIIDYHIGKDFSDTWYVMPIAEPITTHIASKKPDYVIQIICELINTLAELHKRQIYHRDIKPQNLYFYNNRCVLSDFGLVSYPSKKQITDSDRKLGPIATIAPEMRWNPTVANAEKADIYSLSKTLWILLTGNEFAFDGLYDREDSLVSIENIQDIKFKTIIHQFFEQTTFTDPIHRISASESFLLLQEHLNGNFFSRCRIEWKEITQRLFNYIEPDSAKWINPSDIATVLNIISKYNWINHFFFPSGGGLDVNGNAKVDEYGFIRLTLGSSVTYTFKPKSLYFCSVNKNVSYNFFWLECETVEPLFPDKCRSCIEDCIEYYEDDEYQIVSRYDIDEDSYDNPIMKFHGSYLCRLFTGNVVITSKESIWNRFFDSYSGEHNKYTYLDFKKLLEETEKKYPKIV